MQVGDNTPGIVQEVNLPLGPPGSPPQAAKHQKTQGREPGG